VRLEGEHLEAAPDAIAMLRGRRVASAGLVRWGAPGTAPRTRGWTGAALATVAIIMAGAHEDASAADWNVSGSVSTTIEADTNRDLESDGEPVYGATARLGLEAAAV